MKRKILWLCTIITVIFCAFGLIACGENSEGGKEKNKYSVSGNTYYFYEVKVDGADETAYKLELDIKANMAGASVTFSADGTFKGQSFSGKLEQADRTVTVTVNGEKQYYGVYEN